MTIYLAIDAVTGQALPNGVIAGMDTDLDRLRNRGFARATYTGNRLATIDHTAAGWDNDAQPGWFWLGGEVKPAIPATNLDDLKDAIRTFQGQVVGWSAGLVARGVAQPRAKVDQGHDRLYSCLGAVYLGARDTSHTLTNRKIWVSNLTTGAQDIRKVDDFYTEDTGSFDEPPARGTSGSWYAWVDISAPGTKLALTSSVAITGTVPAAIDLLDTEWVDALTA